MDDAAWVKAVVHEDLQPMTGIEGRWRRLVSPCAENRGLIFGMGELAPHQSMGWHQHPEPEIFFVLEGEGEARWTERGEESTAPLYPGTAFYKVGGVPHTMVNRGDVPLRGVVFKVEAK
jgi:quercetin dioxygenase-like cupin family protein